MGKSKFGQSPRKKGKLSGLYVARMQVFGFFNHARDQYPIWLPCDNTACQCLMQNAINHRRNDADTLAGKRPKIVSRSERRASAPIDNHFRIIQTVAHPQP